MNVIYKVTSILKGKDYSESIFDNFKMAKAHADLIHILNSSQKIGAVIDIVQMTANEQGYFCIRENVYHKECKTDI